MSQNQLPFSGQSPEVTRLFQAVNQLILGNANNIGEVTLAENTTTTTVRNSRIGADTVVLLMPTTANAAGEEWHITTAKGSFTITHANAATTDRTFRYVHIG